MLPDKAFAADAAFIRHPPINVPIDQRVAAVAGHERIAAAFGGIRQHGISANDKQFAGDAAVERFKRQAVAVRVFPQVHHGIRHFDLDLFAVNDADHGRNRGRKDRRERGVTLITLVKDFLDRRVVSESVWHRQVNLAARLDDRFTVHGVTHKPPFGAAFRAQGRVQYAYICHGAPIFNIFVPPCPTALISGASA